MILKDKFFDCIMEPAVNFNKLNPQNFGVAFREEKGIYCATVASQFYVADVINVPKPETSFFSFLENQYTDYGFRIPLEELLSTLYSTDRDVVGAVTAKAENLNRYLQSIPEFKREKSRLIMHAPYDPGKTVVMKFKTIDDKKIFTMDGIDQLFIAIEDAPIPASKLDDGFYHCVFAGSDTGAQFVQAIQRCGSFDMDLLYSPTIYDRENLAPIYPKESFTFPVFEGNLSAISEVHLSTSGLYTVMKMFHMLKPNNDVRIELTADPNAPIFITGCDTDTKIFVKFLPIESVYHDKQLR